MFNIDIRDNPGLQFRIDSFDVPGESREEFVEAMQRNLAFISGLGGFLGHVVFEKTDGPTSYNIATMAVWESADAVEAAGGQVRDYYRRIGFDVQETLTRLGIKASIGNYSAPPQLQEAHRQPEGHVHLARRQPITAGGGQ